VEKASGGGGYFTGDPGRYVKKGSGYGRLFPYGLLYGRGELVTWKGARTQVTLKI